MLHAGAAAHFPRAEYWFFIKNPLFLGWLAFRMGDLLVNQQRKKKKKKKKQPTLSESRQKEKKKSSSINRSLGKFHSAVNGKKEKTASFSK